MNEVRTISAVRGGKAEEILREIADSGSRSNPRYFNLSDLDRKGEAEGSVVAMEDRGYGEAPQFSIRFRIVLVDSEDDAKEGVVITDGPWRSMKAPLKPYYKNKNGALVLKMGRDLSCSMVRRAANNLVATYIVRGEHLTPRSRRPKRMGTWQNKKFRRTHFGETSHAGAF